MKYLRKKDWFNKSVYSQIFPGTKKSDYILWLLLIVGFTAVGAAIAVLLFRNSFDLGDGSTFYEFARNLSQGEAIYKDFIHFRTPGSYFLQALSISLFGPQASSVTFALQMEAHALYLFVFALAIGIFLQFKRPLIGLITLSSIALLPGYLQLRTALAFLAIVCYVQARRSVKFKTAWFLASGIVAGIAFTFGQEAAAMFGLTVMLTELCFFDKKTWKSQVRNILTLATGSVIGLLPLLIYVVTQSNFGNFLYYTFYYAFVLQPQGMDLPYPVLSYENILYYIILALLAGAFFIFYTTKKYSPSIAIIITFAIARLVTLFGRSDTGHLVFVLPEIMFLVFLAIVTISKADLRMIQLRRFMPYAVLLMISFYGAIHLGNGWIVLGMAAVMLSFRFQKEVKIPKHLNLRHLLVVGGITTLLSIFVYLIYPLFYSTFKSLSLEGVRAQSLGGVNVDEKTYAKVNAVADEVAKHNPTTLFSFPIQPYYYRLAEKHGARFITFEPQTTEHEQDLTIQDLKNSKPEVIVFDPAQAAILSKSLWKISDYITNAYQVSNVVVSDQILWIMVPKTTQTDDKLVFSLYRKNNPVSGDVHDIQSPDKSIANGLSIAPGKVAKFMLDEQDKNSILQFTFYQDAVESLGTCVLVKLEGDPKRTCESDATVAIPVTNKTILELSNNSNKAIILNNVSLVK